MQPPAPPAARALRAGPHLTHCKSQMSKPGREHDDSQENGKRPALSCFRAGYAVGGPVGAEGEVGSLLWLLAVPQTLRGTFQTCFFLWGTGLHVSSPATSSH